MVQCQLCLKMEAKDLWHKSRPISRGVWSGIIIHVGDNTVIGSMGFKAPPNDSGMVEIGYDIVPA